MLSPSKAQVTSSQVTYLDFLQASSSHGVPQSCNALNKGTYSPTPKLNENFLFFLGLAGNFCIWISNFRVLASQAAGVPFTEPLEPHSLLKLIP